MTPDQFNKYLANLVKEIDNYADNDAPVIIGKTATDFFTDNFQKQGFVNRGLQAWQEVARRINPRDRSKAAATRPILTGETGNLGRSIDYFPDKGKVTVLSDLPYSSAHNEGTNTAGRNRSVTIQKRQFIGHSYELDQLITSEINRKLNSL